MTRLEPLSLDLNIATRAITSKLFPCGFDVTPSEELAPCSLEALSAHILKSGRMLVWSGASEETIYECRETNTHARAWHDWTHWRYQLPFTLEGETATAFVQVAHLVRVYGNEWPTVDMAALILTEVMGQAEHYQSRGEFPQFQRAFTEANVGGFQALASRLCHELDGLSEAKAAKRAIALARDPHKLWPVAA